MSCTNNRNNFPYILQQANDWCIPASIENVMKYYRSNTTITQTNIVNLYLRRQPNTQISFPSISSVLRAQYGAHWDFDPQQWKTNAQFVNYVENCINNNNPVIISTRLLGVVGAHMLTVLCINSHIFRIFDTGYLPTWIDIDRNFILSHLAPAKGTLLITPI